MKVTGIILAGGLGTRFQSTGREWVDKLQAKIDGEPIIRRVYKAVSEVADEVIISTNKKHRGEHYLNILEGTLGKETRIVVDEKSNCKGPLLGIYSSIKKAGGSVSLILPGDMPFIGGDSLSRLVSKLRNNDIIVPSWFDGMVENLVFAGKTDYLRKMSEILCRLGYWSPSGLNRAAKSSFYIDVSEVFSDPAELINVNYQVDLEKLKPRLEFRENRSVVLENASIPDFLDLDVGKLIDYANTFENPFLSGVIYGYLSRIKERSFVFMSAKAFDIESRRYRENSLLGLIMLSFLDASRYLEGAGYNFFSAQYKAKAEIIREFLSSRSKKFLLLLQ